MDASLKDMLPTKLLWVDLEMTGLDPRQDRILEVAAEVTDFTFTTLASYEARIKHPKDIIVDRFQKNVWYADFPENRDFFITHLEEGKPADLQRPAMAAGPSLPGDSLEL